jgi:hypothetical protein
MRSAFGLDIGVDGGGRFPGGGAVGLGRRGTGSGAGGRAAADRRDRARHEDGGQRVCQRWTRGRIGVVITPDGYALSNFHVTKPAGDYMKCGMADGQLYDAVIVGIDPTGDVALIKLLGRDDFPYATMGDSDQVRIGRLVLRGGQPVPAGHRFSAHGDVRHRLGSQSLPTARPARCWNTPTASRPTRRSIRATRADRCSTPRRLIGINGRGSFEKRGRVNVGSATPSRSTRSRISWATCTAAGSSIMPRWERPCRATKMAGSSSDQYPGDQRRLSPRTAVRGRDPVVRRPAGDHRQRIQEHVLGDLSQGLARPAQLPPGRRAAGRVRPLDGRPSAARNC